MVRCSLCYLKYEDTNPLNTCMVVFVWVIDMVVIMGVIDMVVIVGVIDMVVFV